MEGNSQWDHEDTDSDGFVDSTESHELFYDYGTDYILTGESEFRSLQIIKMLSENVNPSEFMTIDGLGTKEFYNPPKKRAISVNKPWKIIINCFISEVKVKLACNKLFICFSIKDLPK